MSKDKVKYEKLGERNNLLNAIQNSGTYKMK